MAKLTEQEIAGRLTGAMGWAREGNVIRKAFASPSSSTGSGL